MKSYTIEILWISIFALFQVSAFGEGVEMSSPEGTTTKYVQSKGVLVFAPRAARAQKVVFDTPDKQLIFEPDTPFRAFFDSHSADFAEGRVDYAKTTILGDVVNMLKNKEYIRLMIDQVIQNHLTSAISPQPPLTLQTTVARVATCMTNNDDGVTQDNILKLWDLLNAKQDPEAALLLNSLAMEVDVHNRMGAELNTNVSKLRTSRELGSMCGRDRTNRDSYVDKALVDSIQSAIATNFLVPKMEFKRLKTLAVLRPSAFNNWNSLLTNLDQASASLEQLHQQQSEAAKASKSFQDRVVACVTNDFSSAAQSLTNEIRAATIKRETVLAVVNRLAWSTLDEDKQAAETLWTYYTNGIMGSSRSTKKSKEMLEILTNCIAKSCATLDRRIAGLLTNQSADILRASFDAESPSALFKYDTDLMENLRQVRPPPTPAERDALVTQASTNLEIIKEGLSADPIGDLRAFTNANAAAKWSAGQLCEEISRAHRAVASFDSGDDTNSNSIVAGLNREFSALLARVQNLRTQRSRLSTPLDHLTIVASRQARSLADNDGKWRERHARILTDALYLELLRENYPDNLRDEDIQGLIERFFTRATPYSLALVRADGADRTNSPFLQGEGSFGAQNNIWDLATKGNTTQADEAMAIELYQVLKERKYFREIIDQAVSKRKNLFKSTGQPTAGLDQALAVLTRFCKENIPTSRVLTEFCEASDSLWYVFLSSLNSGDDRSRVLKAPGSDRPLTPDELKGLGGELRAALSTKWLSSAKTPAIAGAGRVIIGHFRTGQNHEYLRASFDSTNTCDDLLKIEVNRWVRGISQYPDLVKAVTAFTNAVVTQPETNRPTGEAVVRNLQDALFDFNISLAPEAQLTTNYLRSKVIDALTNNAYTCLHNWSVQSNNPPLLGQLLQPLSNNLPPNISAALKKVTALFQATFDGVQEGFMSDEPVLSMLLARDSVPLGRPESRKAAVSQLLKAFRDRWQSAHKEATLENVVGVLSEVFKTPENAFLFYPAGGNEPLIEAFKTEFYTAFRSRLQEALAAEIEPDYDYWWVTFYPKAIPLGTRTIEGQSIIEIAFPEAIVPEQQYHRWLQDGHLVSTAPPATRSSFGSAAEKLYRARTVLLDFRLVLEGDTLSQKFESLRPKLVKALAEFAPSSSHRLTEEQQEEEAFRQGLTYLEGLATEAKGGRDPEFGPFCSDWTKLLTSQRGETNLQTMLAKSEKWRKRLATNEVDARHVFLAVALAAAHKATLPEAIDLYLSAFLGPAGQGIAGTNTTLLKAHNLFTPPESTNKGGQLRPAPDGARHNLVAPSESTDNAPPERLALDAEEHLHSIIANSYFSAYPGVPSREAIKCAFLSSPEHIQGLIYKWLSPLLRTLSAESPPGSGTDRNGKQRQKVVVTSFLDNYAFLTPEVRSKIISFANPSTNSDSLQLFHNIRAEQRVMDQLSKELYDVYYKGLFRMLSKLEETDRHRIAYDQVTGKHYKEFVNWAKPSYQRGIQIVEVLPTSRDDLVATSVSEGGVVARAAAQADAAIAYDLNKIQMVLKAWKQLSSMPESTRNGQATNGALSGSSPGLTVRQPLQDFAALSDSGTTLGYSLGASAKGSIYARAHAALAYSKRREYLNAAITAAGRGDNFAKWVIRKADLRSNLAALKGKKAVAVSHTGYPNGDQPFQLLVKVPRGATFCDWRNKRYIFFNSAYVATMRDSWYKKVGFAGVGVKAAVSSVNPAWWTSLEEKMVATVYPFKWEVKSPAEQRELIQQPSIIGGAIWLDEMDKIKYSEVLALIEAEADFVAVTRQAQSAELGETLNGLGEESKVLQKQIADDINSALRAQFQHVPGITNQTQGK